MNARVAESTIVSDEGRSTVIRSLLATSLSAQGFYSTAFLPRESLMEVLDAPSISEETRQKYDVDTVRGVVVVALRYGNGEYPAPDWALHGGGNAASLRIARFARANWYREISRRLGSAVAETIAQASGQGIELPPPRMWHRLVNSGLPEKALALKAGLGWAGKNTIVIAAKTMKIPEAEEKGTGLVAGPAFSSAILLGLLLCPVEAGSEIPEPVENRCGECRRCVEACPTGALIDQPPGYDRQRCIQHWTAIDGDPPSIVGQALRGILYGCDSCLEACPHFIPDVEAACSIGCLGSSLPSSCFLEETDLELRHNLAGSALDRAWMSMDAFRRNARLAL